jgi:hypothetical protein
MIILNISAVMNYLYDTSFLGISLKMPQNGTFKSTKILPHISGSHVKNHNVVWAMFPLFSCGGSFLAFSSFWKPQTFLSLWHHNSKT